MENSLNNLAVCYTDESYFKNIEEYKIDIVNFIKYLVSKDERLVFAIIAERSGITRFVIRQYPELRNFILEKIAIYKEIQLVNRKIDRAVKSLLKSNKSVTFIALINKCKFSTDVIYHNNYIKHKIRNVIIEHTKKRALKRVMY
jgi:hypothetical protein